MKKSMIPSLALCLLALHSVSCSRQEEPASPHPGDCRVEVSLSAGQNTASGLFSPQTSGPQPALRDANLYAFHALTGDSRHVYLAGGASHSFSLPAGAWDFYVLANTGEDMGALGRERLETLALDVPHERVWTGPGGIPMSAHQRAEITGNASVTLELKRLAARLRVNVGIAPAMSGRISVGSVQLISVPATVGWFGQQPPQRYIDYPAEEVSSMSLPRTYYVAENPAGSVPEITRPQERSAHAAPGNAARIRITGVCDGRVVHYYVFPGENTTSDFNVRRNRDYMLNITLHGANPEDARVSTTEAELAPWNTQYFTGETARSRLTLSCLNNADNWFDLSYELLAGSGSVEIDGHALSPGVPFRLLEGGSNRSAEIAYTQQDEGAAALRLTLRDRYGFTIERELATDFLKQGPRVTFTQEADSLYGYELGSLMLHISQPGYTGTYKVKSAGVARVCYDYDIPLTELTLPGDGDYPLWIAPARFGPNSFRITVTDDQGRSAQIESAVVGRTASVQVRAAYTGGGMNPLTIMALSSLPVGEDLDVTIAVYLAKLTTGGKETATERITRTLTIPAGTTVASYWPQVGTGYMGYVVKGEITITSLSAAYSRDRLYHYEISK